MPRVLHFALSYQYIRMELCHCDMEDFIRDQQDHQMLTPEECRVMLFQMAFALYVAAERFGVKHYDVKLLNFFLQSVTDNGDRRDVVLRYGVGSNIFQLRMKPSVAFFAKLGDFGTAVMGSDTDCEPVGIGQFTTLENTPPDFLILGNAAKQGHGHDSFGLGLCMLHLFTGHCPYEEILGNVVCPKSLRDRLRAIWTKKKSYDVICSVIIDSNGNEDRTLYDTLYRFLVLFGIPEHQFGPKESGDVWRAIKSILTPKRKSKCSKHYSRDREKYSLSKGTDKRIAGARDRLSVSNRDVLF